MTLTAIAAVAQNGIIGNNNDLIWRLPDDLKHFKTLTKGHTIIMGRKTWESIGARPLPHRKHIIITRNLEYDAPGAEVVCTIDEAIELARGDVQPFIVGGGEIYKLAMPFVKRLELTIVHHDFQGDTKFPDIDMDAFMEVEKEFHPADEKHEYDFTFLKLDRI
jgi:dihydrofolate reductase